MWVLFLTTADTRLSTLCAEAADALTSAIRPRPIGPHVGHPVLGAAPIVGEDRRIDERRGLARARKDQHVELGIAADGAEVARVGDVEVPHRRPAAQDQT